MELTSQLSNIEEELKLLKGEIKSILKEIRTAVLNSDNPFTGSSATRIPTASPASSPDVVVALSDTPQEEPTPFSPRPVDLPLPHPVAEAPRAGTIDAPFAEPVPLHSESHAEPPATSLLTIASLLAWAEDAIGTLGARRFRLMLELAYSAELLSPEVRDVLREVAEIWSTGNEPDRPVSVNECLLQLRQLEAIVNGERVARIPRRRSRRRG